MKMHQFVLSIVTLALSASAAFAQGDTEFTYQGRLLDVGEPANGAFNLDFRLWDAPAAGNQVDVTNTFNSLPIQEGLFTVELDFGASAFNNNDRWLEITVDGVPLVPRQPITRAPYAIQTRGIFVDDADNIGIGTSTPIYPLHVESDGILAMYARATEISGQSFGGWFQSDSTNGSGVFGVADAATGTNYGVSGQNFSTSGGGVFGLATAGTGTNYGGRFESFSTDGRGVLGEATAATGVTYGGRFLSASTDGRGVFGEATATAGSAFGGNFRSDSTSGRGVFGLATASTGTNYGGWFQSVSTSGYGVYGVALAGSGTTYGGLFKSLSTSGYAAYFDGKGNDAVYVVNTGAGRGLHAVAPSDTAVWAQTTTGFAGVHGQNASATGLAVYGQATATSGTNFGVYGVSNSASGYDFYAGGAGVNYGASSSRRWKSNIVPIGDPLAKLSKLKGVYFDWDEEHGGAHDIGMIAEEVGAVLPEIVQYEENGIDASGMDYSKMTPLLVEAVNALRAEKDNENTSWRAEITSLSAENSALRAKNSDLRSSHDELQQRFTRLESIVEQLQAQNN